DFAGGYHTVVVACSLFGVAAVRAVERIAVRQGGDPLATARLALVGGALFLLVWIDLARSAHIEDVVVYAATIGAIAAIARRRPVTVGLLIGIAIGAKQWAVILLPLVLALEDRDQLVALGTTF